MLQTAHREWSVVAVDAAVGSDLIIVAGWFAACFPVSTTTTEEVES